MRCSRCSVAGADRRPQRASVSGMTGPDPVPGGRFTTKLSTSSRWVSPLGKSWTETTRRRPPCPVAGSSHGMRASLVSRASAAWVSSRRTWAVDLRLSGYSLSAARERDGHIDRA